MKLITCSLISYILVVTQCFWDNYELGFVTGVTIDISTTYWYAYGERYIYLIAYIVIISMMVLIKQNETPSMKQSNCSSAIAVYVDLSVDIRAILHWVNTIYNPGCILLANSRLSCFVLRHTQLRIKLCLRVVSSRQD